MQAAITNVILNLFLRLNSSFQAYIFHQNITITFDMIYKISAIQTLIGKYNSILWSDFYFIQMKNKLLKIK